MAEATKEKRTLMYSVRENGEVVVHKLPFDAEDPFSRKKFDKLLARGFTFNDPRKEGSRNIPEVIVTRVVDLSKPIMVGEGEGNETETTTVGIETTTATSAMTISKAEITEAEGLAQAEGLAPALPFTCPECGGGPYKGALGLVFHMRKHQRERGERPPYPYKPKDLLKKGGKK